MHARPPKQLTRRRALGMVGAMVAAAWGAGAEVARAERAAPQKKGKLQSVSSSKIGVTLTFHLKNAPFPKGSKYDDPSVIVFVPAYFRLPKARKVDVLVHFHGHNTTAKKAMVKHRLREQMHDSKQNAILVMPQGPVNAADSSGGKLDHKGGLSRMLSELLREIGKPAAGKALKKSSLAGVKAVRHLILSAHSGGYRVASSCLRRGGINVNETFLFDALYGQVPAFRRWVVARKGKKGRQRHKLISQYAGGKVKKNNLDLLEQLKKRGVPVLHEKKPGQLTRAELTKGTAIFMGSPLAHGEVTFRHNGLRDCLYASGFRRHKKSDWFKNKNKKRKIDKR
jgi:hypothetical protein